MKKFISLKRWGAFVALALLALVLLASGNSAMAQVVVQSNFVDPSSIANNCMTPFNNSLTWVVGATAVLMVIYFIKKALKLRA